MNKLSSLAFSLLVAFEVSGQTHEFGKVTMEELQMIKYPKDTSANAIILFDVGESRLNSELQVVYKRHIRIKFFNKASLDEWATRTIYLTKGEDRISKLKAASYNLEGGAIIETKMDDASIFKTKYDRYTDGIKFTIPNVKSGSVIEFSYVLRTSASWLPGWQFQYEIPTIHSEYEVDIPSNFTFKSVMRGFLVVSDHAVKKANEKWIMKDVPAFKEEPFTANSDDYISKISFYLSEVYMPAKRVIQFGTTWPTIVKDLLAAQDFGIQIKASEFINDIVSEITAQKTDDAQKAKAIYDYVKSNVEWNHMIDKIPDRPFKEVLEEKKGSTSEINLLLVSMLQKAGLKSHPVLLSTRKHGLIHPVYPRFQQFNDVICLLKIGEKKILLDATDRGLPMNALPERCLNGEGLVVSKEEMEWIPIVSIRSRKVISAEYKLNPNGGINGQLVIVREGIAASNMREEYKSLGKEKYIENLVSGKSWELISSSFENVENSTPSVSEIHEVLINDHTQSTGNIIYLNPYLLDRMEENIFKSEQRLYPVDYSTPLDNIYMAKIQLPEGFNIEELPKQKMLLLPGNGGKFVYSATQMGSTINFVSQFIINKSVFSSGEYFSLREFYTQVVAKQAEQIVLKKK